MDKRITLLIALLAREYRNTAVDALEQLKAVEAMGLSPEELAEIMASHGAGQDLPAVKKGLEKALSIVDEGVEALAGAS